MESPEDETGTCFVKDIVRNRGSYQNRLVFLHNKKWHFGGIKLFHCFQTVKQVISFFFLASFLLASFFLTCFLSYLLSFFLACLLSFLLSFSFLLFLFVVCLLNLKYFVSVLFRQFYIQTLGRRCLCLSECQVT